MAIYSINVFFFNLTKDKVALCVPEAITDSDLEVSFQEQWYMAHKQQWHNMWHQVGTGYHSPPYKICIFWSSLYFMVHFINCSGEQDITQHPEEIAPFHTEINEEEINFVKKSWSAAFFHGRRGFTSTVWFNCAYLVLFVRILAPYRTLVII